MERSGTDGLDWMHNRRERVGGRRKGKGVGDDRRKREEQKGRYLRVLAKLQTELVIYLLAIWIYISDPSAVIACTPFLANHPNYMAWILSHVV